MNFTSFTLDLTDSAIKCFDTFLNALKVNFPEFAMYQDNVYYFALENTSTDYISDYKEKLDAYVADFDCLSGEEDYLKSAENTDVQTIVRYSDPTIYENPDTETIWINKESGELFTCIDRTQDKNIWVGAGTGKIIQPIPYVDTFDFLGDGKFIAFYKFDKNLNDVSGKYNGIDYGIRYITSPVGGSGIYSNRYGSVKIKKLPFNSDTQAVTISSWMYWNGESAVMPYGWDRYDVYLSYGWMGFNTGVGDITGFDFRKYRKKWVYVSTVFKKGELGKIYLNGVEQTLNKKAGRFNTDNALMGDTLSIFGWNRSKGYRNFGYQDRLRIYDGEMTADQISLLYTAEKELLRIS